MKLQTITLHNIRSYKDETVEFPEGSVLLSGDIGSGKTSILLAIEFALFGIRRGTLTGSDLLRHGAQRGTVELTLEIDGQELTIHRELKRQSDRIAQQPGYIVINDRKFEGTPVELKAKVIELLGYPKALVSKSKSLIYRYTVYTPQERMKEIIYDDPEDRLDTLRKVFNIDKYKRVKENAALLRRELKSKRDVHETRAEDLDETREKREEKQERLEELSERKDELAERIEEQEETVEEARETLQELEERAEDIRERKSKLETVRSRLQSKQDRAENVEQKIQELQADIEDYEEEEKISEDDVDRKIDSAEQELENYEETLSQIKEKVAVREQQRDDARETKQKISELDQCPLCKQDVSEEHIEEVRERQNERIQDAKERLDKAAEMRQAVEEKKKQAETKLEKLRTLRQEASKQRERRKRYNEKQERLDELQEDYEDLQDDNEELREREEELSDYDETVLERLTDAEETYDEATDTLQELEVELATVKQDEENVDEVVQDLQEEIEEMEEESAKAEEISEKLDWLQEYFIPTVDVMERHVMLRIYDEFNEYFKEWFNRLIDDETLQVRLDTEFTPTLVQDGHETTVENLSGGERTSLALAYRLSLTKVINDFLSAIKTKDLIILDEPTDGFSADQLDTVRDVLDALDVKQVIIVSHEPKLETFVDSVINVVKRNNVSTVEQ